MDDFLSGSKSCTRNLEKFTQNKCAHTYRLLYIKDDPVKKLYLSLLSIFSAGTASQELSEFSTSMDFDEIAVVEKYLQVVDAPIGKEISTNISRFKESTATGESQRFELKTAPGYMLLELEDEFSLTIAIFTHFDTLMKIEEAYGKATEELEI